MTDFNLLESHSAPVRVPPLWPQDMADDLNASDIEEWGQDFVEWLGLVALGSARIQDNDSVDPALCNWSLPAGTTQDAMPIRFLRWKGLVDSGWVAQLLITCM